jgi:protein-tyrosine phosphatase
MVERYSRHIRFENITNFRDLGGYRARDGYTVAWRRLFRSGEFNHMTGNDLDRLTGEIGLTTVLDLRSDLEVENQGVGLLTGADIRYHNISFITDDDQPEAEQKHYRTFTNMGEFYLEFIRYKGFGGSIVRALEVIADPENHPLVFHCAIGKDRTGILAAILLSALGVADEDIIEDYTLSTPYMEALLEKIRSVPEIAKSIMPLPDFFWTATAESMNLFLSTLKREYGSIGAYLAEQGAEPSLIRRLENALLT